MNLNLSWRKNAHQLAIARVRVMQRRRVRHRSQQLREIFGSGAARRHREYQFLAEYRVQRGAIHAPLLFQVGGVWRAWVKKT